MSKELFVGIYSSAFSVTWFPSNPLELRVPVFLVFGFLTREPKNKKGKRVLPGKLGNLPPPPLPNPNCEKLLSHQLQRGGGDRLQKRPRPFTTRASKAILRKHLGNALTCLSLFWRFFFFFGGGGWNAIKRPWEPQDDGELQNMPDFCRTQRAQYPLIKECTLNHTMKAPII